MLAWFVLFGHAYAIIKIPGLVDPLSASLKNTWIGAIAVELFFFIFSGPIFLHSFPALLRYTRFFDQAAFLSSFPVPYASFGVALPRAA